VTLSFRTYSRPDISQESLAALRSELCNGICISICGKDDCGVHPTTADIPEVPGFLETPLHLVTVPIPQQSRESTKVIRKQCETLFKLYNKTHKPGLDYEVEVSPAQHPIPESVKKRELAVLRPGDTVTATMIVFSGGVALDKLEPGEYPAKDAVVISFMEDARGRCLISNNMTPNFLLLDLTLQFDDRSPTVKTVPLFEQREDAMCQNTPKPVAVVIHRIGNRQ
jgi:hypothetical protein